MTTQLITHYHIRLDQLYTEIDSYDDEKRLWQLGEGISNSGGTLALHLVGNLNHFIGHGLGGTDYVRDRPAEFGDRNVPKATLLTGIISAKMVIEKALSPLSAEDLLKPYPKHLTPSFADGVTIEFFLFHLLTHLSYHLGQVNYHRRLLGSAS